MVDTSWQQTQASPVEQPLQVLTTEDFINDLHHRLASARERIAIQLMTFDGDAAGLAVAEALLAAAERGVAVQLLIDSFALRFVSDQLATSHEVSDEYALTLDMYDRLAEGGVNVRFTNPNGPLRLFSLARNHKKLVIIDDIAYLGGINISDHNFAWHDFMVRVLDGDIRQALLDDFEATFAGIRRVSSGPVVTNKALEETFDQMVRGAQHRVIVASPYAVDWRLPQLLERATAPDKQVIVATENNFRYLQLITPYVTHRLVEAGARLFAYERFSHAKFVLADDRLLIGSSNFGRHSFWCNQEIGLVIDDPVFIEAFSKALLTGLTPVEPVLAPFGRAIGWLASAAMVGYLRLYGRLVVPRVPLLGSGPRRRGSSRRGPKRQE